MAIDGWNVSPEGVQGVLLAVQGQADELGARVGLDVFASLSTNLAPSEGDVPLNGITGQVAAAVGGLMDDQSIALKNIVGRITAGVWGVSAATIEYNNGDGSMAAAAEGAAADAANSGILQYFTPYGYVWEVPSTIPTEAP